MTRGQWEAAYLAAMLVGDIAPCPNCGNKKPGVGANWVFCIQCKLGANGSDGGHWLTASWETITTAQFNKNFNVDTPIWAIDEPNLGPSVIEAWNRMDWRLRYAPKE